LALSEVTGIDFCSCTENDPNANPKVPTTKIQTLPVLLVLLATAPLLGGGCGFVDDLFKDEKAEKKKKEKEEEKDNEKKRDECIDNLKAIKTAQASYDAAFDQYINVHSFHPDSKPGKSKREFTTGSAFDTLAWMPDEEIRGSYKVVTTSTTDFTAYCITDVDGDGKKATFTATKTLKVKMTTKDDVY
jgi:hypothetical protein